MIQLTDEQAEGVALCKWLAVNRKKIGIITGSAGTGKTSLMEFVQKELQDVLFLSPTGKAAARLTEKTGTRAQTLHKWLFTATEGLDGEPIFAAKPLEQVEQPVSGLVCVDEASMVGADMWSEIYNACVALGLSVVLVGDENQLPPVSKPNDPIFSVFSKDFFKTWKPAFYHRLNFVHRQALESPIIRAATAIRNGDYATMLRELEVLSAQDALSSLREFDMILSHTNKTRHGLNAWSRHSLGRRGSPQTGEPLLVLRNNAGLNVFNGETYSASEIDDLIVCDVYDRYSKKEHKNIKYWTTSIAGRPCIIGSASLEGMDEIPEIALRGSVSYFKKQHGPYLHCNYGYTLSAHKAQGSEADSVLVCFEPTVRLGELDGRRWAYTALTRAKETCKISVFDWNITKAIQNRTLEL